MNWMEEALILTEGFLSLLIKNWMTPFLMDQYLMSKEILDWIGVCVPIVPG